MFENRTDLALEERESFEGNGGEIGGVALREWRCHGSSIRMTEVSILNEKGAESMGKPMGTYLTMEDPGLSETEDAYCEAAAGELGRQLASLIRKNCASTTAGLSILVAGLGNRQVTPDSLGPRVVDGLSMNRHLRTEPGRRNGTYLYTAEKAGRTVHPVLSGIHPGVMAQTGMEPAEIVRGVVRESRPDLVMLDEPSLGLAPLLVREIFDIILKINAEGKTVLLVEQNALAALSIAHYAYVLEVGRVVAEAPGQELLKDPKVKEAYLGG